MWIALILIHLVLAISAGIVIILFGARPTRSLSWLLLVLFLPIFGVVLYLLFGINRRKFKFYKLKETKKRQLYDKNFDEDKDEEEKGGHTVTFKSINKQRIATLIENTTHFEVLAGNKVDLLLNAKTAFDVIFEALGQAKKFIHLEYYIFEEGKILNKLSEILLQKLADGVEVRIIYDAFGSYEAETRTLQKLKEKGASVFPVMPLKYGSFLFTINYRNHRKAIIIDGLVGFVGGMNISDKYIEDLDGLGRWEDMHLKLAGPIVNNLHRVFIKDYYFASDENLLIGEKYLPQQAVKGDIDMQLVASGPDSEQLSVLQQYLMLINVAQESICITNPYFIPNEALLQSIKIAALSGVHVRILVPKKTDSKMATFSMFSFFEELITAGVEIFLLDGTFSHSKVIIVDKEVASVGSGNFDHRSFEHNYETNALIYNEKIAHQLYEVFGEDCSNCEKINVAFFEQRGFKRKLIEGAARLFSPLL